MRTKARRATRAKATRAKATRAIHKYYKTKYHRKKGRKSTRKKQRRHSRKGGMPPRRRPRPRAAEPDTAEPDTAEPDTAEFEHTPPESPVARVNISPSTELDPREKIKAELRAVAPMFREHYLKSDDEKAKELQNFKDTQSAAQRRFAYEQNLANAKTHMALNWAMKTPEEKDKIYQQYKKQQEDALARL